MIDERLLRGLLLVPSQVHHEQHRSLPSRLRRKKLPPTLTLTLTLAACWLDTMDLKRYSERIDRQPRQWAGRAEVLREPRRFHCRHARGERQFG